jgi:hypothetical protein
MDAEKGLNAASSVAPARGKPFPGRNGGTLIPFAKGASGNQLGNARALREVRAIGRSKSPEAMHRLWRIIESEPDGRVVVAAVQLWMTWTHGDPRNLPPDENTGSGLDLSKLTDKELAVLVKVARENRLQPAPTEERGAATIDGAAGP